MTIILLGLFTLHLAWLVCARLDGYLGFGAVVQTDSFLPPALLFVSVCFLPVLPLMFPADCVTKVASWPWRNLRYI